MSPRLLRARILTGIGWGGLVGTSLFACGSIEQKRTYTDGGQPINVPTTDCKSGREEVECFTPAQLPRINQGNGPPDAAPTPPPDPPRDANRCVPKEYVQDGCCNSAVVGPVFDGTACCYRFCTGACCGRPLFIEGTARLPEVAVRSDWGRAASSRLAAAALDPVTRASLADAWLADARMEHASIASFARFTLDLLAIGAPPELVEASQRAAIDEIAHARLCFGIANRVGGTDFGPGLLDVAGAAVSTSLAEAAEAAVREGCIGETLAALVAEAQLRVATEPDVRAALEKIARDEARHAELAWRFVAWAAARDAEARRRVARAFAEGLQSLPAAAPTPVGIDLATWHAFGRLTEQEARAVAGRAVREVVAPCALSFS